MRLIHPLLALAVEVAMLVALAVWGFGAESPWLSLALGIGAPVLVAAFWGVFLAPRAPRPVLPPTALALKAVLFLGSAALLAAAGYQSSAVVLAVVGASSLGLEATMGPAAHAFEGYEHRHEH